MSSMMPVFLSQLKGLILLYSCLYSAIFFFTCLGGQVFFFFFFWNFWVAFYWGLICLTFYLHYTRAGPKVVPPVLWAHNVSGRYWRYSSIGWTFPPISHYMLLPYNRWQQRGSLTEWRLTWKCVWSKGGSQNSSMQKKRHPLTSADGFSVFLHTNQWMWAQWSGGWCVSSLVPVAVSISTGADFLSVACRLLLTAGQNAYLIVVTMLKASVL